MDQTICGRVCPERSAEEERRGALGRLPQPNITDVRLLLQRFGFSCSGVWNREISMWFTPSAPRLLLSFASSSLLVVLVLLLQYLLYFSSISSSCPFLFFFFLSFLIFSSSSPHLLLHSFHFSPLRSDLSLTAADITWLHMSPNVSCGLKKTNNKEERKKIPYHHWKAAFFHSLDEI